MRNFAKTVQRLCEDGGIIAPGVSIFPRDILYQEWIDYKTNNMGFRKVTERELLFYDNLAKETITFISNIYSARCECKFLNEGIPIEQQKALYQSATKRCIDRCNNYPPSTQRDLFFVPTWKEGVKIKVKNVRGKIQLDLNGWSRNKETLKKYALLTKDAKKAIGSKGQIRKVETRNHMTIERTKFQNFKKNSNLINRNSSPLPQRTPFKLPKTPKKGKKNQ